MFGREAAVRHMLLASESPKYLGMDEGILNVKLLQNLYRIVGYNLAKSRATRDGTTTTNRKPAYVKVSANVLVKNHTARAFEPKYKDYCVVKLLGSGRVIVKDNHGTLTTFHRRDVKPIDMDIKVADLFTEERNMTTRDANHTMPKVKIPDLQWKDYLPPEINQLDCIAIEQGKVEDLECNCMECYPAETNTVEVQSVEAEHAPPTTPTEIASIWSQAVTACRNIFQIPEEYRDLIY